MLNLIQMQDGFNAELALKNEAVCPCCLRRARINKLSIHSTLALMLARLFYASSAEFGTPSQWIHIERFRPKTRTGNDFSIVKHWGLAEAKAAGSGEDKISSGMWRLTSKGEAFVRGEIAISKNVFVLDDRVLHMSDERTFIQKALGKKFSFSELNAHLGGDCA